MNQAKGVVLAVDDEPAIARLYARVLGQHGYQVVIATNGLEAKELLDKTPFDVIVSDVSMPGMTGIELLRAVRERDLDVPVVIVTGTPSDEAAAKAVEYGALMFLVKPLAHHTLVNIVSQGVTLHRLATAKRSVANHVGNVNRLLGDRVGLEVAFERALGSLSIAYQPLVRLQKREIYGYEALLRSREPHLPNPLALLEAAERLGRLHELGRAIRAKIASVEFPKGCVLFVNLHPTDLDDEKLYEEAPALLSVADRVVLEITERATLDEIPSLPQRIQRLRSMGFQIAIDDLGAGYAGLTSFAELSPEVVKIDMSLVRGIGEDAVRRKLVGTIASLCHDLRVTIVAEGIETPAERDAVAELGVDLQQGYLFAKPGFPFPTVTF
jgi:EAL domain-containing protein (putative c-di-GMP-specific phosphodiesterase class I)/CheY-like chemotaxis protein